MATDAVDQLEVSKKDDFFDDEPPKLNGELPNGLSTEEEAKVKDEPPTEIKDGGDSVPAVDEASGENATQDPDAVAASGGEAGDGGDQVTPPEEEGVEPAAAAANQDETADEGFQSTSPPPMAPQQQQQQQEPVEDQVADGGSQAGETLPAADQDTTDVSKPEVEQVKDEESTKPEESEQPEAQVEGQGDGSASPVKDGADQQEDKAEADADADQAKYDNDYEDSFSQCSQKSIASVDSTGKTLNPKIEPAQENGEAELKDEQKGIDEDEIVSSSPIPPPKAASPTPSRDSRAEGAGAVDTPVVVEEPKTDGRSSMEVKENGEYRGEDRTDLAPPEGTEDSRGQGQWKSPEDQYLASAVLAQKTEQEALKEVQEERDRLLEDQANTKSSLNAAEEELMKKTDLLVAEREMNASRDKTIKALQEELSTLYAKEGEGSEERIKDLQERMAVLARENEEKEHLIQRLNEELRATNLKLKDTEKKLALSEQERARQAENAAEAPKSKTCVVM